jgi:hypothetical protein
MISRRSISLPLFAAATTLVLAWPVTPAVAQNAYITNNGSSNAISASGACLMDVVPVTTGMDQLARHSSALGTITTCWRKAADQAAIVRESRSKFRKMTHNPFQRETNE